MPKTVKAVKTDTPRLHRVPLVCQGDSPVTLFLLFEWVGRLIHDAMTIIISNVKCSGDKSICDWITHRSIPPESSVVHIDSSLIWWQVNVLVLFSPAGGGNFLRFGIVFCRFPNRKHAFRTLKSSKIPACGRILVQGSSGNVTKIEMDEMLPDLKSDSLNPEYLMRFFIKKLC